MESISIGLLGLGTVGAGVVKIVENHQDKLSHQIGCPVKVKKALVQDLEKDRGLEMENSILTLNPEEVLFDPEIDIVVEVMGGIEATKEHLLHALHQKKHVVTANKDLMALHGPELLRAASENGCDLFYEASVAGGIPILRSLVDGLASDRITKMMGIVNGTTNFILTKMTKEGRTFDDVLKEAQDLGYAEADPTADVGGLDAARKMAILSTLGFSMNVDLADVKVKGITEVTGDDIQYAEQFGYTMKLIGYAHREGESVEVSVEPTLLQNEHPLASVHDEYNAVYVYGEAVGETMFYGPGAGSLPTATAVVSDMVGIMKNMRLGVTGKSAVNPQFPKKLKERNEIHSKYFLRLHVQDEVGVLAKLTSIFSHHGVSFEKILQNPLDSDEFAEIVLVTHKASLDHYEDILMELKDYEGVHSIESSYRVEGGDKG
ncbi:homoserine dehydrogenase [Rossellomorea aquimaris]|jgi:homoserine dehydrogenase|uniref:Homoserine dehydrogenase n=1 Tax=Rossellomorea aquimaris TaxID=189382 RepID=A0A5D4ULK1_9BACI|nr:homoserine dehydrogenase [Rossellomorea aquimaris]TYS81378.1 homoserine dehydrogenase [Rossellomorea aquimaris]TYS88000.1 homoserine dehydrogenase [Rossellomorea aquimaris]TYS90287.1 homoserine dehydrogenase [Rossellomorea aquimaris]